MRYAQYSEAVLSVYKELNDIIKEEYKALSGEELDGIKLVSKVFNKNNPVFIFPPDLLTENHQKEQEGYHLMFIGALTGIRNPHAHKNFNLEPKDALYKILLASHLLDKFENRST